MLHRRQHLHPLQFEPATTFGAKPPGDVLESTERQSKPRRPEGEPILEIVRIL